MHNNVMRSNYVKYVIRIAIMMLLVCICVLGEKLIDANRKVEASRVLINRITNDKFKYVCDTLSKTDEYEVYHKAYHIGDIVIE